MENLRLYLTHFAGLRCSHALAVAEGGESAWPAFAAALGVDGAAEGERVDGPLVSGIVERVLGEMVLLRDEAGIIEVYAHPGDGVTHLAVRAYRYGDGGAAVAAREEPALRAWMDEHVAAAAR
jgi:hypothetical protein